MVNMIEPNQAYSSGDFVRNAAPIIFDILKRGKVPGLCCIIDIYEYLLMLFHHFRLMICKISKISHIFILFSSSSHLHISSSFLSFTPYSVLLFNSFHPSFLPLILSLFLPSLLSFLLSLILPLLLPFFLPTSHTFFLPSCSNSRGDYHVAAVAHTRYPRCTQTHTRGTYSTVQWVTVSTISTHTHTHTRATKYTQHTPITL